MSPESSKSVMLSSVVGITTILMTGCSQTPSAPAPAAPFASSSVAGEARPVVTHGPEYANVSNQGGGGVYAENGATLVRQPNGLRVSVTMPTPEPGTYNYPAGRVAGHPEVFTLWVFIFNYPNLCTAPCNADDLGVNTPAKGGVYNGGGHVASGNSLTIAGRVGVGESPFNHAALEAPGTAEVHLAIAPHGDQDPSKLPGDFRSPTGPPPFWWVAMFH